MGLDVLENNALNHKGTIKLESERLILRRLTMADAEAMYNNLTSDADVTKFTTWTTHKDVSDTKELIKPWIESYKNKDFYFWGIEYKETSEFIGVIAVTKQDDVKKEFEIGMAFSKKYWGKRLAPEATITVMEFLKTIGYKSIITAVEIGHESCLKALKRDNFKYLGMEKGRGKKSDGTSLDLYVFRKEL